jgi:hypothetical protein
VGWDHEKKGVIITSRINTICLPGGSVVYATYLIFER